MSDPVVRHPGEGQRLVAGPTTTFLKVTGSATDGRLSAVEMHVDGGWDGPPLHVHERIDHLWWVIDGQVSLHVGDSVHSAGPGACVFVPAGIPHGFSTLSSEGAVILQVDSPEALDGYFEDLAKAFPTAAPPDPEVVGTIMRRHDTRPTGHQPPHR